MRIPYIAQRYCGAALTTDVNKALIVVLQTLYKLSQMDNGSSELASYGYHIHAIKR
jgi:fucose permease